MPSTLSAAIATVSSFRRALLVGVRFDQAGIDREALSTDGPFWVEQRTVVMQVIYVIGNGYGTASWGSAD
jgi:hypothetical protein